MKRLICIALASAMLYSALPVAFAEEKQISLDPCSSLYIEDGYVENVRENCTAAELLAEFSNRASLTVTDRDGNALALTDKVGASTVTNGSYSVKTYLPGDVNEDSGVSSKDVSFLLRNQAGFGTAICAKASDVNHDGAVNAKDAAQLMKYLAGWDVSLSKTYAGVAAEYDDPGIDYCFDSVLNRVGKSDTTLAGTKDYVARMAKNELEDIQLLVTSDADRADMTIEVGAPTNASGAQLGYEFLVGYYYDLAMLTKVEGERGTGGESTVYDRFVSPLPEYRGEKFNLEAYTSKMFALRVTATAEDEAGLYKSTAILRDADGKAVKQMEFRIFVWDFTLPETPASASAFELGYSDIYSDFCGGDFEKMISEEYGVQADALYDVWYEYLLKNHLSAYHVPHEITTDMADEHMSDPRVTSFCVNGGGAFHAESGETADRMRAIYAKLRTNPEWLDKAYIYTVDEPGGEVGMNEIVAQYEWASEMIPEKDFHIVIPMAGNNYFKGWDNGEDIDALEIAYRYSDILCPQTMQFENYVSIQEYKMDKSLKPKGYACTTSAEIWQKYGQVVDRWHEWKEKGDKKMWWYICCSPMAPFANFFEYYQGVDARMVLWQQYFYDVDGLLYWSTTRWGSVNRRSIPGDGDGLLLFSGNLFGQGCIPVSCIRLEFIRDGFEDFGYLRMLEALTDRRSVLQNYVERLTTDLLRFSEDYTLMESVRGEVGFMLESLCTK